MSVNFNPNQRSANVENIENQATPPGKASSAKAQPERSIMNMPPEMQRKIFNALRKVGASESDWISLGRTGHQLHEISKITSRRPQMSTTDRNNKLRFVTKQGVAKRKKAKAQGQARISARVRANPGLTPIALF